MSYRSTSSTEASSTEEETMGAPTGIPERRGCRFITAFGSVLETFRHLGVTRIACRMPYSAAMTASGRALLEEHGVTVVNDFALPGKRNIYDLTRADACSLGRVMHQAEADAVTLSGVRMPTPAALEADTGKPLVSAAPASLWHALRCACVKERIEKHGPLMASP